LLHETHHIENDFCANYTISVVETSLYHTVLHTPVTYAYELASLYAELEVAHRLVATCHDVIRRKLVRYKAACAVLHGRDPLRVAEPDALRHDEQ
jgi:hypothetical protein